MKKLYKQVNKNICIKQLYKTTKMDEIKLQIIKSFFSGIGKTTGGLLAVGICYKMWNVFNLESNYLNSKDYYTKSKYTQTNDDLENENNLYREILDKLVE